MSTQNNRKFKDQLEIFQKNWILSDLKLKLSIRKKLKLKSKLKAFRKNTMKLWTKSKITKKILISKSQRIISWTIKLNISKKRKMIWSTKFHNIKRKNLSLKKRSQKSCSTWEKENWIWRNRQSQKPKRLKNKEARKIVSCLSLSYKLPEAKLLTCMKETKGTTDSLLIMNVWEKKTKNLMLQKISLNGKLILNWEALRTIEWRSKPNWQLWRKRLMN